MLARNVDEQGFEHERLRVAVQESADEEDASPGNAGAPTTQQQRGGPGPPGERNLQKGALAKPHALVVRAGGGSPDCNPSAFDLRCLPRPPGGPPSPEGPAGCARCRERGRQGQVHPAAQPVGAAAAAGVVGGGGYPPTPGGTGGPVRTTVGASSPHFHHDQHIHWSSRLGFPTSSEGARPLPCREGHDVTSLITPPRTVRRAAPQEAPGPPPRRPMGTIRVALPRSLQMAAPLTGSKVPAPTAARAEPPSDNPPVDLEEDPIPPSKSISKKLAPSRKAGSRRGRSPTKKSSKKSSSSKKSRRKPSSRSLSRSLGKRSRSPKVSTKHVHHFHGTKHDKHSMSAKKSKSRTGDFTIEEAVTEMLKPDDNVDDDDVDHEVEAERDAEMSRSGRSSHGSHEYETEIVKELRCRYYTYGCDYVKSAWEHENECKFRPVPCPDLKCWEKVAFCKLLEHIKDNHPFALWLGEIAENYVSRQYWNIKSYENFSDKRNTWVLTILEFDGHSFISVFTRVNSKWYSWVYIVSHMMDARMYEYDVRIANPDRKSANAYQGLVHPIDEISKDIIRSHNCFVTTDETVKNYMTKEGLLEERIKEGYDYRLPIEYKITKIRDAPMSQRKDAKPEPGILSSLLGLTK